MSIRSRAAQAAITWLNAERPRPAPVEEPGTHEALMGTVQPGDVLLMEGMTRVGGMIKTIAQSTWSHAALCVSGEGGPPPGVDPDILRPFVSDPAGAPVVLEALLGQGVILTSLAQYRSTRLRLCRPRHLLPADRAAVVAYALARLGDDYGLRGLVDLARLALPWPFIPWRLRPALLAHRAGPHTRTVCSVLIAEAFASVGYPIRPKHAHGPSPQTADILPALPKDFDLSPFFDVIKPAAMPSGYRTRQQEKAGIGHPPFAPDSP